jgi:segregation and condensation protein B
MRSSLRRHQTAPHVAAGRLVRPIVPGGPSPGASRGPRRSAFADDVWDDRAESDAQQLVGLLFVAAEPLKRAELTEALRISPARLARACEVLHADPPRGLRLLDVGDQLSLVSGPACTATIERYLRKGTPEGPLSQAALEVLAIVAYEQPVTRADIRAIRQVNSDAVVETLMARKLIADDPRFGGRGRPAFLVTTPEFLRRFGLSALGDLPARPTSGTPARGRWAGRGAFHDGPRAPIIRALGGRSPWPLKTCNSHHVPR